MNVLLRNRWPSMYSELLVWTSHRRWRQTPNRRPNSQREAKSPFVRFIRFFHHHLPFFFFRLWSSYLCYHLPINHRFIIRSILSQWVPLNPPCSTLWRRTPTVSSWRFNFGCRPLFLSPSAQVFITDGIILSLRTGAYEVEEEVHEAWQGRFRIDWQRRVSSDPSNRE